MMHKSLDRDVDLAIFDIQKLPEDSTSISSSGPQEVAGGAVARRVAPNAKCSSCYHYMDHEVACGIGTAPMKCGIGDDPDHGYAPLVMGPKAAQAWKDKRNGAAAPKAQADASVDNPKAEFKIQILGDSALTLSEKNPMRKSEYRPPYSWLRFMSRYLGKSEHPIAVAADIWWARMDKLPARFEKGLFQEIMTRAPTEAEVARSTERSQQPEGISKSAWRKTVIKSAHLNIVDDKEVTSADTAKGDADSPLLKTAKAKQFYREHVKHKAEKPANEKPAKKSVEEPEVKKSTWDYRDSGTGTKTLKGDELEGYLQGYVEDAAREAHRDLRADAESAWYKANGGRYAINGAGTWGDVESAKEEAKKGPPAYFADHDGIAHRVWHRLMAKLPDNKNLLAAKRAVGLTQESLKARVKGIDFGA